MNLKNLEGVVESRVGIGRTVQSSNNTVVVGQCPVYKEECHVLYENERLVRTEASRLLSINRPSPCRDSPHAIGRERMV